MNYNKIIKLVKETNKFIVRSEQLNLIKKKSEADFVTDVDIKISNFLKEKLTSMYPQIGFFSEEEKGCLTDPSWILDPIDGTTNLVYGYNMSSVSLGLYKDGVIQFGLVYNPFNDECFTAERGKGAYLNGIERLHVSNRKSGESIIEFGAGSTRKHEADENFEIAKNIFKECIDIRRICSSALDLCFIAAGRIDGYFESKLKPWDIAAGSLILSEAGGMITDYTGRPIQLIKETSVIASNGIVHDFLMDKIHKC